MAATPKKKSSKSRTGKRHNDSAKRLILPGVVVCSECGKLKLPHTVCKSCGSYGRQQA